MFDYILGHWYYCTAELLKHIGEYLFDRGWRSFFIGTVGESLLVMTPANQLKLHSSSKVHWAKAMSQLSNVPLWSSQECTSSWHRNTIFRSTYTVGAMDFLFPYCDEETGTISVWHMVTLTTILSNTFKQTVIPVIILVSAHLLHCWYTFSKMIPYIHYLVKDLINILNINMVSKVAE